VLSCLILALAVGFFASRLSAQPSLRFLLITGFCGGFSTFSAFSFETAQLLRTGNTALASINVALSLTVCIGLVYFLNKNLN
jgi:CrcB protein